MGKNENLKFDSSFWTANALPQKIVTRETTGFRLPVFDVSKVFDNLQLNGDWLKMQELVHRLNSLSEESESMTKEKRGIIPFSTSHDFMSPTAFGDLMSYY